MKTIRRLLMLSLLLVATLTATANRGGFYYEDVDIYAEVLSDNVWEVTETFTIMFEEPRHGFYRYIPKKGINEIDDIDVEGWEYTLEDGNDEFCIIRIGDADREVLGRQTYTITYRYTYVYEHQPEEYELYHTILGTDFEQPIQHLTFTVAFDQPLPDDFAELLVVNSGEYGSEGNNMEGLDVSTDDTSVSGEAYDVPPLQGITLYAPLPDDFFSDVHVVSYTLFWVFFIAFIAVALLLLVVELTAKHNIVTPVIEFYPPEGLCSAEVGIIIDDTVDDEDLASLIPWLANQGYISVRELYEGEDLELTRLKNLPPSAPTYQRKFMNLFFKHGEVVKMKEMGEYPEEIGKIKMDLKKVFTGDRELTRTSAWAWLFVVMAALGTLALWQNTKTQDSSLLFAALLYGLPCLAGCSVRLLNSAADVMDSKARRWIMTGLKTLAMAVATGAYILICCWSNTCQGPLCAAGIAAVCVGSFIVGELLGRLVFNTEYRDRLIGRLLGFREFIETAEKDRLEALQTDDPAYFYKILPYAMVFKQSKKWAKHFKDITVEKPSWYESSQPLMGYALASNLTHSLSSVTKSTITTISHSSDSGSSGFSGGGGGGFSGGGGGGGGGGSW